MGCPPSLISLMWSLECIKFFDVVTLDEEPEREGNPHQPLTSDDCILSSAWLQYVDVSYFFTESKFKCQQNT